MESTTDSIRALAPKWSLAGDEKLLNLLQSTHQKIVSRCLEVNTKLEEMASSLDNASIDLQNVNSKFMALSNSQFIESRVYDDDADVTTESKPVEEPQKPKIIDEITLLKDSLAVLEDAHETAEILDVSDSDDSDAEISVVLKHKDVYGHRPLPYIIGSQAWKNKWHAGLMIEDSDSDSDTSKHNEGELAQYSESEEEIQTDKRIPDTNISESSSSFHSERDKDLSIPEKQSAADVAAELAARLGSAPPRVLEEPEDILPQPTPKTVYRPQIPVSSTIFSDEPPPMDSKDQYSSESQGEDDIFAEINKKQPYNNRNTAQNMADDLFGKTVADDFIKESKSAKLKSTLFDDESEPEMFVEPPRATPKGSTQTRNEPGATRKPAGGISLFGSNKGTESIGAAILQRNRRKSSSSDNDSDSGSRNTIKDDQVAASDYIEDSNINNANYIFDNLFAKAKQAEQKMEKQAKVDRPVTEKSKVKEVKDLFSDNTFDDIDDIFTSNIKIPTKEANKNAKSIFDDDDDLFSDIAKKTEPPKNTKDSSSSNNKKSIFDSDDELFSDVKVTKESTTKNEKIDNKPKIAETKSLNKPIPPKTPEETNNNTTKKLELDKTLITDDSSKNIDVKKTKLKPKSFKSIFDSDSDDDLFSVGKIKTNKSQKNLEPIKDIIIGENETDLFKKETQTLGTETLKIDETKVVQSPFLFEEDEIDDLFINANKAKANTPYNTVIEHKIPEIIPDFVNIEGLKDIADIKDTLKVNETLQIYEDIPEEVKNKKPKIDAYKSFDDEKDILFNKHKETANTEVIQENVLKHDFIEPSKENSNVQSKSSSNDVAIESKMQEPISKSNVNIESKPQKSYPDNNTNPPQNETINPMLDEVPVIEKHDVFPDQERPIPVAFDDIFSEPPAFEKTKEVKKTTNVNALFEDDSDDEALFFKKNDVISDEKPEIFTPNASFGLFDEEPPDFLDIASKTTKNNFNDDALFGSIPKPEANTSIITNEPPEMDEWNDDTPTTSSTKPTQKHFPDDDSNLFSSLELSKSESKTVKPLNKARSKEVPDSDEDLFSNIPKNVPEPSHKENTEFIKESMDQLDDTKSTDNKKDVDTKKIGKLNTKNFNINVQALVPGTSPKKIPKVRSNEDINISKDENISEITEEFENIEKTNVYKNDIKTSKEKVSISEVDNAEPKAVKSISFETKPEAGVLDNNLSKQRPRIQVKRRPSSRRARHEAVRKSVIDLDDDTDNSSSFDEPLPRTILRNEKSKEKELKERKIQNEIANTLIADKVLNDNSNENENKNLLAGNHNDDTNQDVHNDDNIDKLKSVVDQNNKSIFNIHDEITKSKTIDKESADDVDAKSNLNLEENEIRKLNTQNVVVKSKTQEELSPQSTTKVVYILNDEDIFSNKIDKLRPDTDEELLKNTKVDDDDDDDLFKNKVIKTIGNTKETNKNIESIKKDITDTDSKPSINKDIESKTNKEANSFFDFSDDENDLFGKSTKTKKVEFKSKLFESDSEDDLFNADKKVKVKNEKEDKKVKVKSEKEDKKVKGSLFGDDDDDDDLFGSKTATVSEPARVSTSSKRSTISKEAAKPTEIVFDDPLSMLGDD